MKTVRQLFATALCVFSVFGGAGAHADWAVISKTDAMSDEIRKVAYSTSSEGHSFGIYRLGQGDQVWGHFTLSDRVPDMLDPKRQPMYRIDKSRPIDLDAYVLQGGLAGKPKVDWKPKFVNFFVADGRLDGDISPVLADLMSGKELVVRYYLMAGGFKETRFSLAGAGAAVATAIDISASVDHVKLAAQRAFRLAVLEHVQACRKDATSLSPCTERVMACARANKNDEMKYRTCMAE